MTRPMLIALPLLLLFTAGGPAARAAEEPFLAGLYVSEGANPDGTQYAGVVQIVRHGDSFLVNWMFPQAGEDAIVLAPTSVGVGVLTGETFAVSYYGRRMSGVVLYQIEDQGRRLAGRWVIAGDSGAVYSEMLTKVPSPPHEPGAADPPPPAPKRVQPRGGRDS